MLARLLPVLGLFAGLAAGGAHAADGPWETELDEFEATVRLYLEKDPRDVQNILRGLTGLEVSIYFRTDSAATDRFSALQIYNVGTLMTIYPMVRVGISGFSDVRGSEAHNNSLSEKRVEAVKQVLFQAARIDPGRVYAHAYGESSARYEPGDREGMTYDRRITIKLLVHRPAPDS